MAKLSKKQLEKAHKELKEDARQRVAERGILQFRADPETILAVMTEADKAQVPVGALLRQWVHEKLQIEITRKKAPNLVERVSILEKAINKLQQRLQ